MSQTTSIAQASLPTHVSFTLSKAFGIQRDVSLNIKKIPLPFSPVFLVHFDDVLFEFNVTTLSIHAKRNVRTSVTLLERLGPAFAVRFSDSHARSTARSSNPTVCQVLGGPVLYIFCYR